MYTENVRNYFLSLSGKAIKVYRINNQINVPEVRLIGPDGENIGVVSMSEALRLAHEAEMDLIEIGPTSQPPIVKVADYGQFKYEISKRERKQKVGQKKSETKGIRVSLRISQHDLDFKARKAQEFIKAGHRVQIDMFLKGRERAHIELGRKVICDLLAKIEDKKLDQDLKQLGNKLIIVISPKK